MGAPRAAQVAADGGVAALRGQPAAEQAAATAATLQEVGRARASPCRAVKDARRRAREAVQREAAHGLYSMFICNIQSG